jgi:hypothetical protein
MARPPFTLVNLASALLAGPWTLRSLIKRGNQACPDNLPRIRKLARKAFAAFSKQNLPSSDALVSLLQSYPKLTRGLVVGRFFSFTSAMAPAGPAVTWNVPALVSAGQLADWLGISLPHLDWLADLGGWAGRASRQQLRHYVFQWRPRRGGRFRLIEAPKARLRAVQRKILHDLLDRIPPHPAAHGFRRGRSILTYAAPHAGQGIVLRFDLRDFFSSIRASRIHALLRTAGYPCEVARILTGLCTSRLPLDVWDRRPEPRDSDARLGELLRGRHLPQGAPTSPALANLCARRLDVRLHGLAQTAKAVYTRYADDLAFSGGELLERAARRFQVAVAVIAAEEGFALHFQKSRFMRRGVCQQLSGIVVNERPNIRRAAYDELKAILTNCIRHGPATQNRDAHPDFRSHLMGRIAHVEMIHPHRGAKLRELFWKITW